MTTPTVVLTFADIVYLLDQGFTLCNPDVPIATSPVGFLRQTPLPDGGVRRIDILCYEDVIQAHVWDRSGDDVSALYMHRIADRGSVIEAVEWAEREPWAPPSDVLRHAITRHVVNPILRDFLCRNLNLDCYPKES